MESDGQIDRLLPRVGGLLNVAKEIFKGSLSPNQEVDLGAGVYGLYSVKNTVIGDAGFYKIGAFTSCFLHGRGTDDKSTFGDYNFTGREIVFGRKETNGNLFIKNNKNMSIDIVVIRIVKF